MEALRLGKVSFTNLFKSYHNKKTQTDSLISLLVQGTLGCVALSEPHSHHTLQTLALHGLPHSHLLHRETGESVFLSLQPSARRDIHMRNS